MNPHPLLPVWLWEIALTNALLATALAIIVWLVTRFLRNPHVAHLLWCVVLLKLITPPLIAIPIGLPAEEHQAETISAAVLPIVPMETPDISPIAKKIPASPQPIVNDAPVAPQPQFHTPPIQELVAPPQQTLITNTAPTTPTPALDGSSLLNWLPMFLISIWLVGSAVAALLILSRMFKFARQLRRMTTTEDALNAAAGRVARHIGLAQPPPVRLVSAPVGPLLWAGGWTPIVIVPARLWHSLGGHEREALLAHEFAHFLRRDHWIRRGEVLLIILHWWLPTLWWAIRRREAAAEACCDALVLRNFPERPTAYAEALLQALELSSAHSPVLLSQGLGRTSHLKARLTMIVRNHAPRKLGWSAWLLLMGLSVGLLGLSAEIVNADPEDSEKETTTEFDVITKPEPEENNSDANEAVNSEDSKTTNPYAPRTGKTNPFGARADGFGGFGASSGFGAGMGMPGFGPMAGGGRGAAAGMPGMMPGGGMPGMGDPALIKAIRGGMTPDTAASNISPEVREKMRDRLLAIALNEQEPLKVRLSAIDAATSAGVRIESVEGGEKLEAMLWKVLRDSQNPSIQGQIINILAKWNSSPPTVEDTLFVTDLYLEGPQMMGGGMMEMGMGGGMMGMGMGYAWNSTNLGQLLTNLTHSPAGLSRLIAAIEQSKAAPPKEGGEHSAAAGMMPGGEMGMFGGGYGPPADLTPRPFLLGVLSETAPRDDESVNVLLKALEHKAPDIRAAAISALGNLKTSHGEPGAGMSPFGMMEMPEKKADD